MKKITILFTLFLATILYAKAAYLLHNDYTYLQDITFELYNDDVPAYKVPEQLKSIEEILMFDVLHATWKDKHWVAYTLNKDLLGTYKVGQPALLENGDTKKIFFVAAFPGSVGGLDIYTSTFTNGKWSKPKNLGNGINSTNNEANPGLLNDYTLTYSSGGIIKKLDLNTLKVTNLQEAPIIEKQISDKPVFPTNDNKTTIVAANTPPPVTNATPPETEKSSLKNLEKPIVKENPIVATPLQAVNNNTLNTAQTIAVAPTTTVTPASKVISLGVQNREVMLQKYKTAIQLGAFNSPKWEQLYQLAKFGKLTTYINEKGANVVWLTGYSDKAAAESILPQVKAIPGFENAYVTGK